MSTREVNFWCWVVDRLPKKLVYFCVMKVWSYATTQVYIDKHPDEVTWNMALNAWGVE
jgi:hypothetical protein